MKRAGEGTEAPGNPTKRCYLHGGIVTTHLQGGNRSKTYGDRRPSHMKIPLRVQIQEMKSNPELLSLTEHIATLRAIIQRKREITEERMDRYDEYMEAVMASTATGQIPAVPEALFPDLPVGEIELLGKLVKQEYEMRYGRRHSIPVIELQAILVQIVGTFKDVSRKWGIPEGAAADFAHRLSNIKTSQPIEDPELVRRGVPRRDIAQPLATVKSLDTALEDALHTDIIDVEAS